MAREIKTTLMVDGEAAFKRSISEAQTSMRNLGTQLTLAQAQFKKDGDAMKLVETRSKALNAEISQQNEIVKALEKAVEDSSKAYGENSEKTEKWQAELNRAQAKLLSLQNELTLNESGLDRSGRAFDENAEKIADYNATLQQVGKGINFEVLSSGISGITSTIEGAITKVIELGQKIVEVMRETAQWADDLITESIRNGLSVEDQQRMEYASKFADTSVDTIMKARDKLVQKMVKGWKGEGGIDMWEFLGIDASTTRDPMDVLFELGETLKGVSWADKSDVRADEWAMEVFGKGYRDLLPLFNFGREAFYEKMAEAPIVSDEDIEKLGSLNDKFDEFDSRLEQLKGTALAQLAPAMEEIVGSINTMLESFSSWMETDEGKQAMEDLGNAIQELFSGLKDVDFSTVINTVKDAINGIRDGLQWLAEHKGDVETAIKVIAGAFALLKLSDIALNIGKISSGLGGLFNLGNGRGNGNGNSKTPSVDTSGGSGALGAVSGFLLKKALPVVAGVGMVVADSLNNHGSNDVTPEDFAMTIQNGGEKELVKKLLDRYGVGKMTLKGDKLDELYQAMFEGTWNEDSILWDRLENEFGWKTLKRAPDAEPVEGDFISKMTEAQKAALETWWDAFRNESKTADWDESDKLWEEVEKAFAGDGGLLDQFDEAFSDWQAEDEDFSYLDNEDLLKNLSTSSDSLDSSASFLDESVANLRSVMADSKAAAEKIGGIDLKNFNGLPTSMQAAVQNGAAAGVSGIRVQMDGWTVGRLVAPYVSNILAAQVGR